MILILGGTTEGRKAAAVCDAAAKPYFYSTKGDLQEVDSAHGIRLAGAMDEEAMFAFCRENGIRLIVDAAHPFADALHRNVAAVSRRLDIPTVRFEREYAERDERLSWFDTYDDATDYILANNIDNILALTGVNTIAKLRRCWRQRNCLFRILNRDESFAIAQREGFPTDRIVPHGDDGELALFGKIKPQAIITKESGKSGGFDEKIQAANELGIPVLVVKRPQLSPSFIPVFGEHGLRKQIETNLPEFFELKTGYTTGTCATAAAKAALTALLTNETQTEAIISLPDGEKVEIPVVSTTFETDAASCSVIKDAGDDPDVTNGLEIAASVRLTSAHEGVRFLQGKGVGTVTLPGLDIEIGEPAINKTPRATIEREIFDVLRHYRHKLRDPNPNPNNPGVDVTISVPKGEEIALKTFNPRLGIKGGISIVGTSGIVRPFSSEAFVAAIRKSMQVAKALKCSHIVINSGAKSEQFAKQLYPDLPAQAFVHYGNFIGETIKIASELNVQHLTLVVMIGKAVKLAEGALDTHSKKTTMNKVFLSRVASEAGCTEEAIAAIRNMTMARQLQDIIPNDGKNSFFSIIRQKCYETCKPLLPNGELTIVFGN
jgi:cobalt-precorrin-5B (C1)-methyltransferase